MLNEEQYLLNKLAEEGCEVGQMALKCTIFGLDEIYANPDGTRKTNRLRLMEEIADLLTIVTMLGDTGALDPGKNETMPDLDEYAVMKVKKVLKYMEVSRQLGRLE